MKQSYQPFHMPSSPGGPRTRSAMPRAIDVTAMLVVFIAALAPGHYLYRLTLERGVNPFVELLPEFVPAVYFAAGKGMRDPGPNPPEAVRAFLAGETPVLDGDHLESPPPESPHLFAGNRVFALTHWGLYYAVGWCWRLMGIRHEALAWLSGLLCGITAVLVYALFRWKMGRAAALAGTLLSVFSPPFLHVAPSIRDFGKAPFLLAFLLALAYMLSSRHNRRAARLAWAAGLGVLLGVGYGFRQDMLVALPVAAIALLFVNGSGGRTPILSKGPAIVLLAAVFFLIALPVTRGMRMDAGAVSAHTLFQGISRHIEQSMGFGGAGYELVLLPDDPRVHAIVNVHARRGGETAPMDQYLSPAYGRAGRRLFLKWAYHFPADLYSRAWNAVVACSRLAALTLSDGGYNRLVEDTPLERLERLHTWGARYQAHLGLPAMLLALVLLAMTGKARAFGGGLALLYFMAYPSLLFQVRHAFYLDFLPYWAGLYVLDRSAKRLIGACRSRMNGLANDAHITARGWVRPLCHTGLALLLLGAAAAGLGVWLRRVQHDRVAGLIAAYAALDRERVLTRSLPQEDGTLMAPEAVLPELAESWALPVGDAAVASLALEIAPGEESIPITVRYAPSAAFSFSHQILVRPSSDRNGASRWIYFPVYELAGFGPEEYVFIKHRYGHASTAAFLAFPGGVSRFSGIFVPEEHVSRVRGLYRIVDNTELPWLLYLQREDAGRPVRTAKVSKVEKWVRRIPVEFRYALSRNAGEAIEAYMGLMRCFPEHPPYLRRILALSARVPNAERMIQFLNRAALLNPARVKDVADSLAAWAQTAMRREAPEEAAMAYEAAARLRPGDRWHQVGFGDALLRMGERERALQVFLEVLHAAPESPYTAAKLDALLVEMGDIPRRVELWKSLCREHPGAAIPHLYLGIALEQAEEAAGALAALETAYAIAGETHVSLMIAFGRALLLYGDARRGETLLRRAMELEPSYAPMAAAACAALAKRKQAAGDPEAAERWYRNALEMDASQLWNRVRLAELFEPQGRIEEAVAEYLTVLRLAPESPYTAEKLDALLAEMGDIPRRVDLWKSLCREHPGAAIPHLYLGIALEQAEEKTGALAALETAYAIAGETHVPLLVAFGRVLLLHGDARRGESLLRRAVELAPSYAPKAAAACAALAERKQAAGDTEAAERWYRNALEMDASQLWNRVRLAELFESRGRIEEAVAEYLTVLRQAPESPYSAERLDALLVMQGKPEERIKTWTGLTDMHPNAAVPQRFLDAAAADTP